MRKAALCARLNHLYYLVAHLQSDIAELSTDVEQGEFEDET